MAEGTTNPMFRIVYRIATSAYSGGSLATQSLGTTTVYPWFIASMAVPRTAMFSETPVMMTVVTPVLRKYGSRPVA